MSNNNRGARRSFNPHQPRQESQRQQIQPPHDRPHPQGNPQVHRAPPQRIPPPRPQEIPEGQPPQQGPRFRPTAQGPPPPQRLLHQQNLLGPLPTQQAPQRPLSHQRGTRDPKNPWGQQAGNASQQGLRQPSTSERQQGHQNQQSLLGPPPTQQEPQRPLSHQRGTQGQRNTLSQQPGNANQQRLRQPVQQQSPRGQQDQRQPPPQGESQQSENVSGASVPHQDPQRQQSLLGPPPTQQASRRALPPQRSARDPKNPWGRQAENANQQKLGQPSTSGAQRRPQHQAIVQGLPLPQHVHREPRPGPQAGPRGDHGNPAQPPVGFGGFQNPQYVIPVVPIVPMPRMRERLRQEQQINRAEPLPVRLTEGQALRHLNELPHKLWGTKEDRDNAITHFNAWRRTNEHRQTWIAVNILNMTQDTFEDTNGGINVIHSFMACVRMFNFMRWSENEKQQCMQLDDLDWPNFNSPRRVAPGWFRGPRGNFPYLEINENSAMKYLDRQVLENLNVYEHFNESLENRIWDEIRHWIAANIFGVSSDDAMLNGARVRGPVNEQVMRRMQNWIDMNETWRVDFMDLAYIPMIRKPVEWDPEKPETIDCLQDAPHHHRNLRLSKNLAINYLNITCDSPLSNEQTEYLYEQWVKKNPVYCRWVQAVVQADDEHNVQRMGAWLRLHFLWKKFFFENVWPEFQRFEP